MRQSALRHKQITNRAPPAGAPSGAKLVWPPCHAVSKPKPCSWHRGCALMRRHDQPLRGQGRYYTRAPPVGGCAPTQRHQYQPDKRSRCSNSYDCGIVPNRRTIQVQPPPKKRHHWRIFRQRTQFKRHHRRFSRHGCHFNRRRCRFFRHHRYFYQHRCPLRGHSAITSGKRGASSTIHAASSANERASWAVTVPRTHQRSG